MPRTFADRHIGPSPDEIVRMLERLGYSALDDLIRDAIPPAILEYPDLGLPPALSEQEALKELRRIASRNIVKTSMIGLGYYGTVTPAVIQRNMLENPAWYTAYTPYQPEISQGRLEMLLNFQTMVMDLTGMDMANASLLDEATAAAEAMMLAHRFNRAETDTFLVDRDTHPQTIAVLETRAVPIGIKLVVADLRAEPLEPCFGALLSYPASSGAIHDDADLIQEIHAGGGMAIVATDLLALTLLRPPGEIGADVVIGSAQRFGVPMGFGGPHAGFMAVHDSVKRSLPGRLVGVSRDAHGRPALRLALQTREQHIRREKATSNICTAQVLLANMAAAYGVYHGPDGLAEIGQRTHRLTAAMAMAARTAGLDTNESFFDTLTITAPGRARAIVEDAREQGINLRPIDGDRFGVSFDETSSMDELETLCGVVGAQIEPHVALAQADAGIPGALVRTSQFMTNPVFNEYHSETEMLRYLRRLADYDVALDRSMIPLGSCTMKLNATTEMIPITWPEFAQMHPFVPLDQARGYLELIEQLETYLAAITGYDAVSLQPNAGSQGEYAGLLAIRGYHASRGEAYRDVCLIPASAHGTNPASASMAGMRVVVVATDEAGNIDVDDLRRKAVAHADRLAAIMVTYPSTHGVFEETITEVCEVVHQHGGQVYLDGANLNAMVGLARPGKFGSDVSHLNLHKTFSIPHGGGGPGVGPIGVKAHLAPFLPNHPLVPEAGPETGIGAIAAAPWGSAGILPISWAYIRMMGNEGLRLASEVAILSANYMASRLDPHFPVLYRGKQGLVAHEAIVDVRPLSPDTHVTVEDVAKRLIDYGFHAPTMSFPVAGTLMIEPTESESLVELDRFCDAMELIREEIAHIERGGIEREQSVLAHSPHTASDLLVDDWDRPYTREMAAFPDPRLRRAKYWPPVSRVDNAYGDRHIVCACPPMEEWTDLTVEEG